MPCRKRKREAGASRSADATTTTVMAATPSAAAEGLLSEADEARVGACPEHNTDGGGSGTVVAMLGAGPGHSRQLTHDEVAELPAPATSAEDRPASPRARCIPAPAAAATMVPVPAAVAVPSPPSPTARNWLNLRLDLKPDASAPAQPAPTTTASSSSSPPSPSPPSSAGGGVCAVCGLLRLEQSATLSCWPGDECPTRVCLCERPAAPRQPAATAAETPPPSARPASDLGSEPSNSPLQSPDPLNHSHRELPPWLAAELPASWTPCPACARADLGRDADHVGQVLHDPDGLPKCHIVTLDPASEEFKEVVARFDRPGLTAKSVSRVQNPSLWERYSQTRTNLMLRPNAPSANERVNMYHTTNAKLTSLCMEGLDQRLSSIGLFGRGIYSSDNPLKANHYWRGADPHGVRYMLSLRVLLGRCKVFPTGKCDQRLLREPTGYDSVSGNVSGQNEFVTYTNDRVHIDYVIGYVADPTICRAYGVPAGHTAVRSSSGSSSRHHRKRRRTAAAHRVRHQHGAQQMPAHQLLQLQQLQQQFQQQLQQRLFAPYVAPLFAPAPAPVPAPVAPWGLPAGSGGPAAIPTASTIPALGPGGLAMWLTALNHPPMPLPQASPGLAAG